MLSRNAPNLCCLKHLNADKVAHSEVVMSGSELLSDIGLLSDSKLLSGSGPLCGLAPLGTQLYRSKCWEATDKQRE